MGHVLIPVQVQSDRVVFPGRYEDLERAKPLTVFSSRKLDPGALNVLLDPRVFVVKLYSEQRLW